MSLKHAILGFLNNSPKTGYDLQKKIESTIRHFWPSTQSQIYRTLADMLKDGEIVVEVQYQDEKPNRKIYSLTESGHKELLRWLSTPIDIADHRNQFLVQLFFSSTIGKDVIVENLRYYRAEMKNRLAFLNSAEVSAMMGTSSTTLQDALYRSIRQNGVRMLVNEIAWAGETIEVLETVV